MIVFVKGHSIDFGRIRLLLLEILQVAKHQVETFIDWIISNPDKALILGFALTKAYAGEYHQLLDLFFMAI